MDLTRVMELCGQLIYGGLGLLALWGLFCVILVVQRIRSLSFPSPNAGESFVKEVAGLVRAAQYQRGVQVCQQPDRHRRALSQITMVAIANRKEGGWRLRQILGSKFQSQVLAGLQHSLSWIHTVARSAPMLGLLGTVVGMIGAFSKIGGAERTNPSHLAQDISLALFTTALGLVIAIPMILAASFVTVRITRLESAVEDGIQQLLGELEAEAPAEKTARKA